MGDAHPDDSGTSRKPPPLRARPVWRPLATEIKDPGFLSCKFERGGRQASQAPRFPVTHNTTTPVCLEENAVSLAHVAVCV